MPILWEFSHENQFFEGCSYDMILKFYTIVAKDLKLKVRISLAWGARGLGTAFVNVTKENPTGSLFSTLSPIMNTDKDFLNKFTKEKL